MERFCPICQKQLNVHHMIKYIDYSCDSKEHHFSERVIDGEQVITKTRINHGKHRLYFKVYKTYHYSEIWEGVEGQRIKIEQIIVPDYSDLEALVNKLRTYMVFS